MKVDGKAVDRVTVEAVIMREDGSIESVGTIAIWERFTPGRFIRNPRVFLSRWKNAGAEYVKQCLLLGVKKS